MPSSYRRFNTKKCPAVSYPFAAWGSHLVSFLSASQSMVARMALPCTEFGSMASALLASSMALGLLLSSSARRARSSCASSSLGSASSALWASCSARPSKFSAATNARPSKAPASFGFSFRASLNRSVATSGCQCSRYIRPHCTRYSGFVGYFATRARNSLFASYNGALSTRLGPAGEFVPGGPRRGRAQRYRTRGASLIDFLLGSGEFQQQAIHLAPVLFGRHGGLVILELVDLLFDLVFLLEQSALGRIARGRGIGSQPHHGKRGGQLAFAVFRIRIPLALALSGIVQNGMLGRKAFLRLERFGSLPLGVVEGFQ